MRTKEEINKQTRVRYARWREEFPASRQRVKIGDIRGKFTVIGRLGKAENTNAVIWLCRCVCGVEKPVASSNLNRGVKSCGCFKKSEEYRDSKKKLRKYASPSEATFFSLFQYYQYNARRRNLSFELAPEQFKVLVDQDCFYCGGKPSGAWVLKYSNGAHRYTYTFNGVDRKNNSVGYLLENCVSCCWPCNKMKTDQDSQTFLRRIKTIAGRHG